MAINLDSLFIHLIVNVIILSPVLWLAGRAIAGKEKAKFTDAILTIVIGTVVGTLWNFLFRLNRSFNPTDTLVVNC